jgi:hypothetical protein
LEVEGAASLTELEDAGGILDHLLAPATALAHMPALEVDREEARRIRQGQGIPVSEREIPDQVPIRALLEGDLLAIGARQDDVFRPRKVLADG